MCPSAVAVAEHEGPPHPKPSGVAAAAAAASSVISGMSHFLRAVSGMRRLVTDVFKNGISHCSILSNGPKEVNSPEPTEASSEPWKAIQEKLIHRFPPGLTCEQARYIEAL